MDNDTAIYKAAKLLREAMRLTISLKATKHSNPLQMVVLDHLENQLKELDEMLIQELRKQVLDEARCRDILGLAFRKICNLAFKITNTLLYLLFLLRQNLYKYYAIRKNTQAYQSP